MSTQATSYAIQMQQRMKRALTDNMPDLSKIAKVDRTPRLPFTSFIKKARKYKADKSRYQIIEHPCTRVCGSGWSDLESTYHMWMRHGVKCCGFTEMTLKEPAFISSFANSVFELKFKRYTDLNFPTDGIDDVLIIDHERREYSFFEERPNNKLLLSSRDLKIYHNKVDPVEEKVLREPSRATIRKFRQNWNPNL